jgi:type I restriction enzyme, S subunit
MSNELPVGWEKTTVGKLTAKNSLFSDGDWVESKDQDPAGLNRLIQLADIGDGKFIDKSARFLNDEQFNRLNCTPLERGDILIARMPDPLGRACIFPFAGGKYATVVDVAVIRTSNADHYWLMSAINSSDFRFQIDLNASGTTRTRIARGALSQIPLVAPPLPEQQKIAAILTAVDDVIESTQAQINKLKDLKTGLMQELLTQGIGHTEFKDSPVGRIPKAWNAARLGTIFPKIVVGYVGNVNDYYCSREDGVPFYRTQNIRNGYFTNDNIKYVTKEFNAKNKKSQIFNDDILIARVGANLGMTCKVDGLIEVSNIANAIIIKSQKDADSDFFATYISSDEVQARITSEAAGGAQGVFNTGLAQELITPVPPLQEQQEIAKRLFAINSKLHGVNAKLDHHQNLKKALMQDLLTGKVRVKTE